MFAQSRRLYSVSPIKSSTDAVPQHKEQRMPSDIEIAQKAKLERISRVALSKLGIAEEYLEPYGHYKAKVSLKYLDSLKGKRDGKLILVTAMTPTPAGEGKTTTTVGLGDALNHIGKKAMICLREPSLGPVFGVKGGAAGGGYAQVVPMEDINLHFTGDFSAIALANNLLAAMLDNHIHHGNELGIDPRRIQWRRVVDMNDRALRDIVVALGGTANGFPREDGFDIVVASEVMAIFCLATSLVDLKKRLGDIVIGYTREQKAVTARELKADGAMAVLLKDSLNPNLVQTLDNHPAFIHGGPFANIAHGCNSVVATRSAMKLVDYVVTESGFGADLGAEKFIDVKQVNREDAAALEKGLVNLERHVDNVQNVYGIPCVVSINRFSFDTPAEIELLQSKMKKIGVPAVLATHWGDGAKGAAELAKIVVALCEKPNKFSYVYDDHDTLWDKMNKIAKKVYRASEVTADSKVRNQIKKLQDDGYGHYPVSVAKTQYSFSTDRQLRAAPSGHSVNIREVRLAAGAEFVVMICGDVMTMPGLPKVPSANKIDLVEGKVVGLF